MKKDKWNVTGWYSGAQTPVRTGVYQRLSPDGVVVYSYWSLPNCCWGSYRGSAEHAAEEGMSMSAYQALKWRGLRA
jgi:hypothetical protein